MKTSTIIWLAEIILTVVVGYFAVFFIALTWVSFSDIATKMSESRADDISSQMVLYSVGYFVGAVACTYVAATAMKAARRGGEWKWR